MEQSDDNNLGSLKVPTIQNTSSTSTMETTEDNNNNNNNSSGSSSSSSHSKQRRHTIQDGLKKTSLVPVEIHPNLLKNVPLHEIETTIPSPTPTSPTLSPQNSIDGLDSVVWKRTITKQFSSEPRRGLRRRCRSGEGFSSRLFDEVLPKNENNVEFDSERRRAQAASASQQETRSPQDLSPEGGEPRVDGNHSVVARPRSRWLIPAEHPFKVLWDIITVCLSIANAYATHTSIRDRKFGESRFMFFCEVWFFVDILLNFVTERKTAEGEILRDYRSVCARYLTSWFAVDALSLFPWETLYVKPIIDIQNKRGFFRKSFFRSKAVVRVTRHLRGKHFRWFGTIARHTKQHGIGAKRLLRLVIKYVPKYLLFVRNMKGVVAVRVLRQVHWFRRFYTNIAVEEKGDGTTGSLTREEVEGDELSTHMSPGDARREVTFENWEVLDDGVPL